MVWLAKLVSLFWSRFVQRTDLYPLQLDDGSYTVVRRPLTKEVVSKHLRGGLTLGLYGASSSTTRWLCIDVDTRDEVVVRRLWQRLDHLEIPVLTEFSGRKGYHLWVFFDSPVPNSDVRALGRKITTEHEIFPKQDQIPDGGVGNLVKAPLGLHRVTGMRCLFVDRQLQPFRDQVTVLNQAEAMDPAGIENRLSCRHLTSQSAFVPKDVGGAGDAADASLATTTIPILKDCVRLAIHEGVEEGRRNRVGYIIASESRRIGTPQACAQLLLDSVWNPRNQPPLSKRETRTIIDSAYGRPFRSFGCGGSGALRQVIKCVGMDRCLYARAFWVVGQGRGCSDAIAPVATAALSPGDEFQLP